MERETKIAKELLQRKLKDQARLALQKVKKKFFVLFNVF